MPWFEVLTCEDCSHEWEEIDASEFITVGTIDLLDPSTFTQRSCPECYVRLYIQRETDGNSWRNWCRAKSRASSKFTERLRSDVVAQISALIAARRTIYQPVPIDLGEINCSRCERPLVLGNIERPNPVCPACNGSRTLNTGGCGHVVLEYDDSDLD